MALPPVVHRTAGLNSRLVSNRILIVCIKNWSAEADQFFFRKIALMNGHYQFHPKLVLRTPQFPLSASLTSGNWQELLKDKRFMEAVYLASPVLHAACRKLLEGEESDARAIKKMQQAILKYYTRMYSRCTPFGLFSGCAVANWNTGDTKLVLDQDQLYRHTRFDMHYLCALAQYLAGATGIKEKLGFTRNSTLYTIGDEVRYIEYYYQEGKRVHKISSIQRTEYIDRVLLAATDFKRIEELATQVVDAEISTEEVKEFIHGLIDAQVLVSELEPAITGPEFIFQLKSILGKLEADDQGMLSVLIDFLKGIADRLKQLDTQCVNPAAAYEAIQEELVRLPVAFDAGKLFQCDLFFSLEQNQVDDRYQDQLLEALAVLHRLSPVPSQEMQEFIRLFKERYEDREMPLLELLDTETGIPYRGNSGVELSPLLNDFVFVRPEVPETLSWGKLEKFWDAKIRQTLEERKQRIELDDRDLEKFKEKELVAAPSLSLMFRLLDAEQSVLYLESAAGSSAANLLGRFAHGSPEIGAIVNDVTQREQELEPAILYAEIVHLPESRMGNILLHPAFRSYEIPYLAKASVPGEFQVPASDLLVSVRNNRVVLRSRKLNREIIPRLSSAHNFRIQPLPVYEFLCDLQSQGISGGYQFNWGGVAHVYKFLPEVLYKKVVLHPATWTLERADWEELLKAGEEERDRTLQTWLSKWRLPEKIVLADGDNELLINFSDPLLRKLFFDVLSKRQALVIREFLYRSQTGVRNSEGAFHANQFIAILQKKEATYSVSLPELEQSLVTDRFSVGSEWLFVKLYCGSRSAEKILTQALYPLTQYLEKEELIRKWFFIRYLDPHFHIRFRVQLSDPELFGKVIQLVHSSISEFEQQGFIWRIQLDTYQRETARYGTQSIAAVETIFHQNSIATVNWLSNTEGDEREHERWLWGLKGIDALLNSFGWDLDKKTTVIEKLKNAFAEEFHTGKLLKQQLDFRYRKYRDQLKRELEAASGAGFRVAEMEPAVREILFLQQQKLLDPILEELVASLIHMQLNRLFPSQPRQHEMICYDFLYRYYYAEKMRKKPVRT